MKWQIVILLFGFVSDVFADSCSSGRVCSSLINSYDVYYTESDDFGPINGYDFKNIGPVEPGLEPTSYNIRVDSSTKYQTMEGFGAALSNAASYLLYNKTADRNAALRHIFDPISGAGFSYIRLVMGGSDFQAVQPYTYDDVADDFELKYFSIKKDKDFIIPLIKEIQKINCNITFMASPWSAPAWMKYEDTLFGGSFIDHDKYYETYADYFVKFIQAYESEGIPIGAITLQNEPRHSTPGYPTMLLTADQEIKLVKALGRKFEKNKIKTEIVIWDHNWDGVDYPMTILDDKVAKGYVSGTGFHCYAGDYQIVQSLQNLHPDKKIHFTECTGTDGNFNGGMVWNSQRIFTGQTRQFSVSATLWNIVLDLDHGPRVGVSGCQNCRGTITLDREGHFFNNVGYQIIKHFAKYVKPGAKRIESSQIADRKILSVAFQNPEGDIVVVVTNGWGRDRTEDDIPVSVEIDGNVYHVPRLARASVATLVQRCS